jgi:hypothetical protein
MKRKFLLLFLLALSSTFTFAQSNWQFGVGYFGHTITHPGVVFELSKEITHSEKAALVGGINLGFYNHPRQHTGLFLDLHLGYHRYFSSGFYFEQRIGLGVLQTILNGEDGVYIVDENNQVIETNGWNQPDFMPSVSLGIGWDITHQQEQQTLLWLRPKLFWQTPQKLASAYHLAVQIGMSRSL